MINDVVTSGALPALEMTIRFANQRQRVIAHNIANFETPGFIERDVSVPQFQEALADAVDARRTNASGIGGANTGPLPFKSTNEVHVRSTPAGVEQLSLTPTKPSGNILYHDRTNRDIERTMQAMVENVAVFRMATELYRSRMGVLQAAIAERV